MKKQNATETDFSKAINPDNLPTEIVNQEYQALEVMVRHALALPDINPEELIRMQDGGELGWKVDEEGTTVEVLEDVLIWDYSPYWGKWELADGKRVLSKRPITDGEAEDEGYQPRVDLFVEWQGEERVIGLPPVGYNIFIKKLEYYYRRKQDIRNRRFTLKTKKVTGKYGPLTIPIFREIKDPETAREIINITPGPEEEPLSFLFTNNEKVEPEDNGEDIPF